MSENFGSYAVTEEDKLWGLLAYIGIPPIVPIIILLSDDKKNNPFMRYHAIQSIGCIVVMWLTSIIVIGLCLSPIYLIVLIYFGYQAYLGEWFVIPYLTEFLQKQGWLN